MPSARPKARSGRARSLESEPEKRRAILHAAVRVFADRGYHGCRIADVAQEAGVAYGLVYHYFKNKDELLESVFAEQWAIFIQAIRSISEGPGTALEQLAMVLGFAVDAFKMAPAAVRVLILEVARTPSALKESRTRETFTTAVRLVSEIIERGEKSGELRGDQDPLVAAACIMGALEIVLTGLILGTFPGVTGGRPPDWKFSDSDSEALAEVRRELVDFALRGLATGAGAAAGAARKRPAAER